VATGEVKATGDELMIVLGEGVGPVSVKVRLKNGAPVTAQLTAARLPEERPAPCSLEALAEVLSLNVNDFVGGDHAPVGLSVGLPFLMVPVNSVNAVKRARVRTEPWERHLKGNWASEPMVFALARDADESALPLHVQGSDVRARVFVPGLSVPEDPATGSANACLAGFLAKRTPRNGTLRWEVAQGVEMGRASRLSIEADKTDGAIAAVRVGGASVVVSEGEIRVP
jgi:trans-2,3-dihydro-3-hydroxyanthranilate isomerase